MARLDAGDMDGAAAKPIVKNKTRGYVIYTPHSVGRQSSNCVYWYVYDAFGVVHYG